MLREGELDGLAVALKHREVWKARLEGLKAEREAINNDIKLAEERVEHWTEVEKAMRIRKGDTDEPVIVMDT